MEPTRQLNRLPNRISPSDGHYFFGYYDVPAFSGDEQYHLCHKVGFRDRLPRPEDVAALGLIRISDGDFIQFDETSAWNFQQGSMLQWLPGSEYRKVVFNRRSGKRFVGVIRNIKMGTERVLDRPVAAVSPQGDYALSINFSRLFDFRPGYGYAGIPDPFADDPCPSEDGIFLTDLAAGSSKLVMSLADIHRILSDSAEEKTLVINHVSFNTDGTRFVCLVRNNPGIGGGRWSTVMLTADPDGGNVYCLHEWGLISHYHWRDAEHLLCYCSPNGEPGLYVLRDRTGEANLVDSNFFQRDGHCSYSPDRRTLLYDSYPSEEGYRSLYVYDLDRNIGRTLGEFYSLPTPTPDSRCDLHPRWSPSGTRISFDSTHEGFRGVYVIDFSELV